MRHPVGACTVKQLVQFDYISGLCGYLFLICQNFIFWVLCFNIEVTQLEIRNIKKLYAIGVNHMIFFCVPEMGE